MARRIENDCCDCATPGYPCRGELCHRRNAVHIYCDNKECDVDITNETKYFIDDEVYCEECILEVLIKDGVIRKEHI